MKPSVTPQEIADLISNSTVEVQTIFDKVTLVSVRLPNGFVLTASSGAVSKENYDEKIGTEICMKQIEDQLWKLEGYALQKRVAAGPGKTAREIELEDLLVSAHAIVDRKGEGTAWERFSDRLTKAGIGLVTPKIFRVLPADTKTPNPDG